jgi:hypothetical protein
MAYGVPPEGSTARVFVGTSDPPTTPVGGNFQWDDTEDTPSKKRAYYGQPTIFSTGVSGKTVTASCDYEVGDAGQQIIFAARIAKSAIFVGTCPDGTNGESVQVKVTNQKVAGPDPEGFSTVNWSFVQQAAPTVMGAGYG